MASLVNAVVVDTSVDIVKVDQASAFAVGPHAYEVSLLQGEAACRDGLGAAVALRGLRVGRAAAAGLADPRHALRRRAAGAGAEKGVESGRVPPVPRAPPRGAAAAESVVRRWVDYYLSRGFDRVCFYVHDQSLIYDGIEGTTWFVLDWLRDKGVHYGGQITAINHCLYWHKERGTSYVLFGDVDEYVVETPRPARVHDLVGTPWRRAAPTRSGSRPSTSASTA